MSFENFQCPIFSSAVEYDRTRVRARLLVVPIACSARQAYRWFYIWVPCSHFIQYRQRFRIRRANVVFYYTDQTWSLRSIVDDYSPPCWSKLNDTIFSMPTDLSISFFFSIYLSISLYFDVCPLYLSIRIKKEYCSFN